MSESDGQKLRPDVDLGKASSDDREILLRQSRAARAAALNLMEDAVRARKQTDQLNTELVREVELRTRSEKELRRREHELEAIINRTPFLLTRCGRDLHYKFVSTAYAAMFGKRPEELEGHWLRDVMGDAAFAILHPYIERVLRGESVEFEANLPLRSGDVRTLRVVYIPDNDDGGNITGWIASILDQTASRRVERALRKTEERLRLVSESFQDFAIFTTDVNGDVVTWNPGAVNIFGYRDEEIIGRRAHILFVPEDQAKKVPEGEMQTAREHGRAADERWHQTKEGSRFYASGVMVPLYDDSEHIGYAKIARDLTKEKQMQEELRRQHDELESIVAGRTAELAEANDALRQQMEERRIIEEERFALLQRIVTTQEDERRRIARDMHDSLGQQLTALRLKLASMKTELYKDGRIGESLESLQELGRRIDAEVSFLVWELRPTVLDDLGLVAAVENYIREWSRHYNIPAEFHAGRLGAGRLDSNIETNLYRITQEALNNVYKHSKARNANVVLESRKKEIVLVVEDDGIGFDPDEKRLPAKSGGGLGLLGMRERAAIIGGRIEIESAPGMGATVFVRVPISIVV